jgi:UDP-N-acetylglucosamine 2-epimerase
MPTIMLWPNVDAGSEDVSRGMRKFREHFEHDYIRFYKNFSVETYVRLMKRCACKIGNSSAAIREGAFLGVPGVNIGTRQNGRERGKNIIDVEHDRAAIVAAIKKQIQNGHYPSQPIYGDGHAGVRIADILGNTQVDIHKKMMY